MLRILSLILAVVIVCGGVIFLLGYTTSPSYKNSITFEVFYSPELTWKELLNIKDTPRRKPDVVSIDILEEFGKLTAWKENLKSGGYRIYRMNKREENKRLILELTESSYGLTGIWTFELDPAKDNNTQITIYEESTLTDFKRRGYRVIMGREYDLLLWQKYIKVGLVQALLNTL
jgi:hypothetical protein